jgi:hypothetical protein
MRQDNSKTVDDVSNETFPVNISILIDEKHQCLAHVKQKTT